ncbi:polymorphic toxin-type HINT domain-containing protein [Streptomyces sp. NPDC050982]|uniref:polymorphic toxin-type HINT domain-containing protein n=1 Tax=Streptomyces sp. NPDC050982 TaxID=3154746 RepID=UPI0033DA4B21
MNGYAYSGNSPVSKSDPTGLCPFIDCPTRPDANAENTTPGHTPGKRKNSQNHQAALARGTAYPAATVSSKKHAEIYPGVFVDKQWKYANEFARLLNRQIDNYCQETSGCLLDAQDQEEAEADRQQLMHLKLLACMSLGRKSGCLGKVAYIGPSMGFLAKSTVGEGPGSLGGGAGGRGPKGSCKCFLAGTDVLMSDGSTKDIEDVELGDKVQATDPRTGESGPRRVTRLIITEDDKHFNELSIATQDGIEKLTATHEHPFWSPSERRWVEAGDLAPGMTLLTDDGDTVIVTGSRSFTKHTRTYNLTVDDLHTYYVLAGDTPVLVHNSTCTSLPSGSTDELAVIGRQVDVEVAKRWPNHEVLNLPRGKWTSVEDNDRWIQGIIEARQPVYVASPTVNNLTVEGRETVFSRELRQLREAGYTRSGNYLLPPAK